MQSSKLRTLLRWLKAITPNRFRFRHMFLIGGSMIVMAGLFMTDPDQGVSTQMFLLTLITPIIALAFAHLGIKALFDYPEADGRSLFKAAREGSVGAGLALIAKAIIMLALMTLFGNAAHADTIPANAELQRQTLRTEATLFWPEHPKREALPALIEHESCVSLKSPTCWNPKSRLKTAREEGAGLGQITRAYKQDGSLRFDALSEMRAKHPELRELTWNNVYQRPDLQLRAVVLKLKDDYKALYLIQDPIERLNFGDSAYNGGMGGVQKDRRACQITKGCDPQKWFGHVELTCTKSKAALYGQRSACDINRHHVKDVMTVRAVKYKGWLA